jgi:serine/threonine-protein kinase HSL1, negative regulator of Swe1 kinase
MSSRFVHDNPSLQSHQLSSYSSTSCISLHRYSLFYAGIVWKTLSTLLLHGLLDFQRYLADSMDRRGRYKKQAAGQRRIPLQEAASKGNSGPMVKATKAGSQHPTSPPNDENTVPAAYAAHPAIAIASNNRQQTLDKRAASSHIQTAINGLRPRKTHIGPWQLGCTIGHGGSCTVRLVRHVKTGENAVAKIIHKKTAEKVRAKSLVDLMARVERGDHQLGGNFPLPIALEREVVIMRLLNHPNIVRIYDVWENSNEIYLIMENVDGGELFQYLSQHGALPEDEAVYIFRQLVEALAYCHRLSIFHRDLKPENILLDKKTSTVKLIDFGMAAYQPTGDKLKTPCGSPHYAAPELLQGQPYDGSKADVWSLGVVLYLMLVGDLPFNFGPEDEEHLRLHKLYKIILANNPKIPGNLSRDAQALLRQLFEPDPKRRLNIFELWHQPLLHKYDRRYGLEGKSLDVLTNHLPTMENWKSLRTETIDSQIFRNLQTLWHDAKEETLIKKLCGDE